MSHPLLPRHWLLAAALCLAGSTASAQSGDRPFEPYHGQPGRDVVWVPTPPILVEKMLDMAGVTEHDIVMDLGSGDGRNIIAAAKRGAKAVGVEFNPDMVKLSQDLAAKAGVADKAAFVQGDMYEADVSQASVLALFLLTENLNKMAPKFLAMKPGSRIVVNGFRIDHWEADETGIAVGDCYQWCTAYLYIVPAPVTGRWRMGDAELEIEQRFQTFTGAVTSGGARREIADGRIEGERILFTLENVRFEGRVAGDSINGTMSGPTKMVWSATRQ